MFFINNGNLLLLSNATYSRILDRKILLPMLSHTKMWQTAGASHIVDAERKSFDA